MKKFFLGVCVTALAVSAPTFAAEPVEGDRYCMMVFEDKKILPSGMWPFSFFSLVNRSTISRLT